MSVLFCLRTSALLCPRHSFPGPCSAAMLRLALVLSKRVHHAIQALLQGPHLLHGLAKRAHEEASQPSEPDYDWKRLTRLAHSPQTRRKIGLLKEDIIQIQEQELDSLDPTSKVPDAADIDWGYWKTKVEPELVTMFQNALKRLKLPRYVPSYEAVDAMFEPILEDARELQEYAAKRVVELEGELAIINYELEKLGSCEDPSRPRLTMEEEMELNPEIFAKVDKEIAAGEWTTMNGSEAQAA